MFIPIIRFFLIENNFFHTVYSDHGFSFLASSQIFSTSLPIYLTPCLLSLSLEKNRSKQTNIPEQIKANTRKENKQDMKNTHPLRDTHIHKPHKNAKSEIIIEKQKTTNINNSPPKQTKNPNKVL